MMRLTIDLLMPTGSSFLVQKMWILKVSKCAGLIKWTIFSVLPRRLGTVSYIMVPFVQCQSWLTIIHQPIPVDECNYCLGMLNSVLIIFSQAWSSDLGTQNISVSIKLEENLFIPVMLCFKRLLRKLLRLFEHYSRVGELPVSSQGTPYLRQASFWLGITMF